MIVWMFSSALTPCSVAISTRRAFERQHVDVAREVLPTHHVEHHVDAAPAGQVADRGGEVRLTVIDRALGAEALARLALGGRARGREHARPAARAS
jgi:hypothetical protein